MQDTLMGLGDLLPAGGQAGYAVSSQIALCPSVWATDSAIGIKALIRVGKDQAWSHWT